MHEQKKGNLGQQGHFEYSSEGELVAYFEQYDGYYSRGWLTALDAEAAFQVLIEHGFLGSEDDFDVERYPDESWRVSTADGSYYWSIDPTGSTVAGVLSPDEGLSSEDIEKWQSLTAVSDEPDGD